MLQFVVGLINENYKNRNPKNNKDGAIIIVEVALIGVMFMRSGGCGLLEWQEFGDFTGCLVWAFSHNQAIAYPQELRMMEEPTSDTGLFSLRQTLLK
jgi:hypothetical protein